MQQLLYNMELEQQDNHIIVKLLISVMVVNFSQETLAMSSEKYSV